MGLMWGIGFGPVALATLIVTYVLGGLAITVGFHRYFAHKSFETSRPFMAFLGILGCSSMQGPITQWVTDHRKHHALSDKEGDPHSPHGHGEGAWGTLVGLFHSHIGWMFHTKGLDRGKTYGKDLYEDRLVLIIDRFYLLWLALSLAIPFLIGYLAGGGSVSLGIQVMIWGGVLRLFLLQHSTWSVNSICHMFGEQAYETRDESRNVRALALVTFGESFHNNHHAFPSSAIHGLDRRQIDLSAWTIRGLERLGLVWDVKRPGENQLERRRLSQTA